MSDHRAGTPPEPPNHALCPEYSYGVKLRAMSRGSEYPTSWPTLTQTSDTGPRHAQRLSLINTLACTTWGTISSAASHGRPKDWGDDTSPVNAAIPTTPVHLGCPNKWILSTQEERVRLCNTNHGNDWCETARCPYLTELHAIKVFCE
ncbi:hypothetical protein PTI98_008507 [Pleurotus ostreatus]|nr:hypothetical protein PTI98_008507 [Pleurotus ostreatus]